MMVQNLTDLSFVAASGKRLVVLGDPVAHSLSPAMHNAALAKMGLVDWRYEAVHVPAAELAGALPLLHAAGVAGINLTLPHKVQALDLVEWVEPEVRAMGAVNTLIRTDSGYRATNTDGYGILKALEEAFGVDLSGADVWLFGAGGAARGIAVACLQAGCQRLTILNRSESRLQELEGQLGSAGLTQGGRIRFCPAAEAPTDPAAGAVLINATSLGLKASDPCPLGGVYLREGVQIYDTTYGVVNELGRACRARGLPYADGLSMLVWQGARSLEIWTGRPVPAETMRAAALRQLNERNSRG